MDKDILSLLADEGHSFSKGQRLIARYITENYDKAAFMTAGKLGKTVGVSESTVVRFATELGYDGYPGMRKAMQEMVRNRLTSVQRIAVARDMVGDENVLKAVMSSDEEKLQSTLEEIDRESFQAAVDAIAGANHLYIVGMRSSASLASFMGFYMNLLMSDVCLIHDTTTNEVCEQIMHIGKGDVYVGISYPRYSSSSLKAMQFAKRQGATVIALTDNDHSPFAQESDISLYAKSDMVSFLDSLVAPMSLINALIVAVAARRPQKLDETFGYLEKLWSEYEVFTTVES
ncbi:MAG: MurR/RpiR family transcriptional regulator [Oscillospiraceae bacterium]|nr:MurR/RpiR family transcriptional regulator [Oscillospiraceae bacterium]